MTTADQVDRGAGFARILILDTQTLTAHVEEDRDDGVYVVLEDEGNRVELPVASPEEFTAAQRVTTALFDAVSRAAPMHARRRLTAT